LEQRTDKYMMINIRSLGSSLIGQQPH